MNRGLLILLAVALGSYECRAFISARMMLNFRVAGTGIYIASSGSRSAVTHDPTTSQTA